MSSTAVPATPLSFGSARAWGSDERLAQRAGAGDDRAFAALYGRYHQRLFRYCRSILNDDNDAADALQSTFERALRALQRGQRNAPLRPWLFRIAHNEAITIIRRRPEVTQYEPPESLFAASAEHQAVERARLATLVADLAGLPDKPRSALIMRELEGLSHEDIAIALQTSVGGAKQAIFEARRALADAEEGRMMSCADIRRTVSDGDGRVLRGRRVRAHMRACAGCREFTDAIGRRSADLRALAPGLPPAAAATILARALGTLPGHSSGLTAGSSSALAGAVGSKLAVSAAVIATATAGAAGLAVIGPLAHKSKPHVTTAAPVSARSAAVAAPGAGAQGAVAHSEAATTSAVGTRSGHLRRTAAASSTLPGIGHKNHARGAHGSRTSTTAAATPPGRAVGQTAAPGRAVGQHSTSPPGLSASPPGTRTHGATGTRTHGSTGTRTHGTTGTRAHGGPSSPAVSLPVHGHGGATSVNGKHLSGPAAPPTRPHTGI